MKAIILNSGIGKRMGDLTQDRPKCLLEYHHGETILGRQLRILHNSGIHSFIMTTGPFEAKIKQHVEERFPGLDIRYIPNTDYRTTNYIYSLYLIPEKMIDQPILLLHGDMVFEDSVIRQLLQNHSQNLAVVSDSKNLPEKDFKGMISKKNRIKMISVDLKGPDCYPLFPVYKLQKETYLAWYRAITGFIKEHKTSVYAEEALNAITDRLELSPLFLRDGQLCMEIDDLVDLNILKRRFEREQS